MNSSSSAPNPFDELFELQLRVARKADELASRGGKPPSFLNLHCWLLAEREVLWTQDTPTAPAAELATVPPARKVA